MARIRSVHPGIFTDEQFVELTTDAQIFVVGLWTEADDQGVFEWKPAKLRMRLRPTKDGPVEPILAELEAGNFIKAFDVAGRRFGAIRNFKKWQRPKKPNAVHPLPPEFRTYVSPEDESSEPATVETAQVRNRAALEGGIGTEPGVVKPHRKREPTASQPALFPQKAELGPQREEGGDRRKEIPPKAPTADRDHFPPLFEALMAAWPSRGTAKNAADKPAFKAWKAALKRGADPDDLIRLAPTCAAPEKHGTEFVPQITTWLNQDRWKKSRLPSPPAAAASVDPQREWRTKALNYFQRGLFDDRENIIGWELKAAAERKWHWGQHGPDHPRFDGPRELFDTVAKELGVTDWKPTAGEKAA